MSRQTSDRYGILPSHNTLAPPITLSPSPRRAFSLPAIFNFGSPSSFLTRRESGSTSPSLSTKPRRLSGYLPHRIFSSKLKVTIGALLLCGLFILHNSSHSSQRRLRTREVGLDGQRTFGIAPVDKGHGLSLLDTGRDEEEWLADEEPLFSQYEDPSADEDESVDVDVTGLSADEAREKQQNAAHKLDVVERHRAQSLRALTWFIAEGGQFPADWTVPSKKTLKKAGGRGVERMFKELDTAARAEEDDASEEIFEDGWAEFAKNRYRVVVFSKSFCPFSKRAKSILSNYRLTPAPYVVELDYRPDGPKIQNLLEHLTGRRTVPNIMIDFTSIGGADELTLSHSEGGLKRKFEELALLPGLKRYVAPPPAVKPARDVAVQGDAVERAPAAAAVPAAAAAGGAGAGAGAKAKVAHAHLDSMFAEDESDVDADADDTDDAPVAKAINPRSPREARRAAAAGGIDGVPLVQAKVHVNDGPEEDNVASGPLAVPFNNIDNVEHIGVAPLPAGPVVAAPRKAAAGPRPDSPLPPIPNDHARVKQAPLVMADYVAPAAAAEVKESAEDTAQTDSVKEQSAAQVEAEVEGKEEKVIEAETEVVANVEEDEAEETRIEPASGKRRVGRRKGRVL